MNSSAPNRIHVLSQNHGLGIDRDLLQTSHRCRGPAFLVTPAQVFGEEIFRSHEGSHVVHGTREAVAFVGNQQVLHGKAAKLWYGAKGAACQAWTSARRDELDEGKVEATIAAMNRRRGRDSEAQTAGPGRGRSVRWATMIAFDFSGFSVPRVR
jgi:hypothetical protein